MDLHTIIPPGLDENLKCFVCKNYLSYFPTSVCSNNQSICGRCVLPEGITCSRNAAFETVCQSLRFPCRYEVQGCSERWQPKDVPQHEENCAYRIVKCIADVSTNCTWSGSLSMLKVHCQNQHFDIFVKNGEFALDLAQPIENQHSFMEIDEKLFILEKEFDFDTKIFSWGVYSNQYETHVESYSCQFSVKRGKTTILRHFDTTSFDGKKFAKVHLHFVEEEAVNPNTVAAKISLEKRETTNVNLNNEEVNSKLCEFLPPCIICGTLKAPIMRETKSMAVICAVHARLPPDPLNTIVEDTILSTMVPLLTYPCCFKNSGCTYEARQKNLQLHQRICQYKKLWCPFLSECKWNGLRTDLESHLQKHPQYFVELGTEIQVSNDEKVSAKFIIKFCDRLFVVGYSTLADTWDVAIRKIGISKEKFTCEIEVTVINNLRHYVMRKPCIKPTKTVTTFCTRHCTFRKKEILPNLETKVWRTTFKVRNFKLS